MKPHLVIIGLGNPGKQYAATRHNIGFMGAEELKKEFGTGEWKDAPKFLARTCEARVSAAAVLLVQPQTFMNRSGESVKKLVDFYKLDPATQLIVLSDDIDLPLGETRFRAKGGPGTHNGMRSIVASIGEGFPRIRFGVGTPPQGFDLAAWMLSALTDAENKEIQKALRGLPERVRAFVMENGKGEA